MTNHGGYKTSKVGGKCNIFNTRAQKEYGCTGGAMRWRYAREHSAMRHVVWICPACEAAERKERGWDVEEKRSEA